MDWRGRMRIASIKCWPTVVGSEMRLELSYVKVVVAMTSRTVLILGGGWGGLALAHQLRNLLSPEHRVVVVEQSDKFALHVSNMWLMTGERDGLDQIQRDITG